MATQKDLERWSIAISEAIDFISSNIDGDETGLAGEMLPPLYDLKVFIDKEYSKRFYKTCLRYELKKRGIKKQKNNL